MDNPQEVQQQPQQQVGQDKEIHERFILNVMKMASEDQYDRMISFAQSADNGVQALARAANFIISAVKKGLEGKGVQIPSNMWLAENGLIDQSIRLISALLIKAGIQLTADDVAQGSQLVAEALAVSSQAGQQQPQQQPQQQQGMLSEGGA